MNECEMRTIDGWMDEDDEHDDIAVGIKTGHGGCA